MEQNVLPLELQFFADGAGEGQDTVGKDAGQHPEQDAGTQQLGTRAPAFDYDKLANIISGKQSVAEDTVLKNFFKQQGMSKEEMEQAISRFKEEKAKNQPDVEGLKSQASTAQRMAQQAMVEKEAVLEAMALGVDGKTIPYLIRLADLSGVMGEDGKVNKETLKKALENVLEDVPQLKPKEEENRGFQIGSGGNTGQGQTTEDDLKKAFGL